MPTVSLRRFSNPDILKQIGYTHLVELLSPHKEFFTKRSFQLPSTEPDETGYEALANIFMVPDNDTPDSLIDALFFIDEMSTKEMMDALIDSAKNHQIELALGNDPSPADVAVRLWLKDQSLFEEIHAEKQLTRPRSFIYFQTDNNPVPKFIPPTRENLDKMGEEMDDWFEEKNEDVIAKYSFIPVMGNAGFLYGMASRCAGKEYTNKGKKEALFIVHSNMML